MASKNKIIKLALMLLISSSCLSQNGKPIICCSTNEYSSIATSVFKYYTDSINQVCDFYFVFAFISEFDTSSQKLRMTLNYTFYNPLELFNATHIDTVNNKIFVIRFGNIDKKVLKKLQFSAITNKVINNLRTTGEIYSKKNNYPTYSSSVLVFELNKNYMKKIWYNDSHEVPIKDRIFDDNYLNSNVPYKIYLKSKLKEYNN